MMRNSWIGLAALSAVVMQPALAGTFALGVDASGRFYDNGSTVYSEIGAQWGVVTNPNSDYYGLMADGNFCSAVGGSCLTVGQKIGSGVVVFESRGNFSDLGTITYNDATGAITGLTLKFGDYINVTATNPFGWNFTSSASNVNGTVQRSNGVVTGIDLTSNVSFLVGGQLPYNGTFVISGNSFALDVAGSYTSGIGTLSLTWDLNGTVNNVSPVPEPATYAMMGLGLLIVGSVARGRRRGAAR